MNIKLVLFDKCLAYVNQRIANAQYALNSATESANDETKSSSGDKHETGRAMAQLEQEKTIQMLTEANNLKQVLAKIKPDSISPNITLGSLVITNKGKFYIAISAGKIEVESDLYFAISSTSPIGAKLMGKTFHSEFYFNGISYRVEAIL